MSTKGPAKGVLKMKFSINQRLKIALIVVLVFAIGGTSFLLYRAVKHPGFEEQNVPIYSYNNKATVDFMVYFKPNELYNTKSMNKDQIYITEFVDHISRFQLSIQWRQSQ